jgi:hypothetical protein
MEIFQLPSEFLLLKTNTGYHLGKGRKVYSFWPVQIWGAHLILAAAQDEYFRNVSVPTGEYCLSNNMTGKKCWKLVKMGW